jgi:RNA polymerase sigma-70 factor, ECF subfamily
MASLMCAYARAAGPAIDSSPSSVPDTSSAPAQTHAELDRLIAQIAKGDRRAFRELYNQTAGLMLRAAKRILGDHALAEDAVQEAFLRVWRSAGTFDPSRGEAKAWMGRIVRNACFDRLPKERDSGRIEGLETVVLPVEPMSALFIECLEKLPKKQCDALILMYVHGLTHSELANHLGAPLGTIKSWIKRGSHSLRLCMGTEK